MKISPTMVMIETPKKIGSRSTIDNKPFKVMVGTKNRKEDKSSKENS